MRRKRPAALEKPLHPAKNLVTLPLHKFHIKIHQCLCRRGTGGPILWSERPHRLVHHFSLTEPRLGERVSLYPTNHVERFDSANDNRPSLHQALLGYLQINCLPFLRPHKNPVWQIRWERITCHAAHQVPFRSNYLRLQNPRVIPPARCLTRAHLPEADY